MRPQGASNVRGLLAAKWAWARPFLKLRAAIVMAVLLSYVWRFHDLSPVLYPFRLGALSTAASWLFLLFAPRIPYLRRALKHPAVALFIAGFIWIVITAPFAMSPARAWFFVFDRQLKTLTMFLFLLGFFVSWRQVRVAVVAHVFGVSVLAYYYAKQGFPTDFTPVPMYDRNDLALHLAVASPLVAYLAMEQRNVWLKRLLWALAIFVATGAILSQSRGAFLAICGMAVFILLQARGIRLRTRMAPLVLLGLGIWLAPPEVQERLSTLTALESDYNMTKETGRKAVWTRSLTYIVQNPVLGVGVDNFGVADGTLAPQFRTGSRIGWSGKAAHNSFLQVAVETGLPGGLLFLGMIGTACWRLVRTRRRLARVRTDEASSIVRLCNALLASFIGYCIGGFFLSQGYSVMLVSLVALAAGVEMTASGHLRSGRTVEPSRHPRPTTVTRRRRRTGPTPSSTRSPPV